MVVAERQRARDLADLLDSLGNVPTPHMSVRRDEQFLAFLSLQFLLPKLLDEKRLEVQRYENALRGIKPFPQVPPEVPAVLNRHLAQLQRELASLEQAAATVAGAARAARGAKKDPSAPSGSTNKQSDAGPAGG
jgi:hypothetical protein